MTAMGRAIEHGSFPFAWSQSILEEKAVDDPEWPGESEKALWRYRFTYDGLTDDPDQMGLLTGVTVASSNGQSTVLNSSLCYDGRTRLRYEKRALDAFGCQSSSSLEYEYDNLSNVTKVTYPAGRVFSSKRNQLGDLTEVHDETDGIEVAAYE